MDSMVITQITININNVNNNNNNNNSKIDFNNNNSNSKIDSFIVVYSQNKIIEFNESNESYILIKRR